MIPGISRAAEFGGVTMNTVPTAKACRVYIAGPMTGLPHHNFPAFRKAACDLNRKGYHAVSPLEINGEQEGAPGDWMQCMRKDIAALVTRCDFVALLPGWQLSRGALLEHYIASSVGIMCQPIEHFLQTAAGRPPANLE